MRRKTFGHGVPTFFVWDFSSRLGMLEDPFVNQTNNGKKSHKLRGTLKRKKRNVQCKK